MDNLSCINREEFSNQLTNIILKTPSKNFQFIGKNGIGKKYVLEKVEDKLKKQCEIYRVVSDALMKKNHNVPTHTLNVAFSLGSLIGMSLSPTKNDRLKINYIISNLKTLTLKKILLISASDYDILPVESREFLDILLCNKKFIEEQIKKSIAVIITSSFDCFNGKYEVANIFFKEYERKDIYNYLVNVCGYTPNQISNEKLNQICKLCGTNLNLIKSYANLVLNIDDLNCTFESIVDTKLNYFIQAGYKYNLSKDESKSILFASAMSIHVLTPEMISYINNINKQSVEKGFVCAIDENFLEEEFSLQLWKSNNYLFVSQDEKKYLCDLAGALYLKKISDYYIYLSNVAEDEYFERAQYLVQYYGNINKNVFTLIILAISKNCLANDILERNKIISFFNDNNLNESTKQLFEVILDVYDQHYEKNYAKSNELLSTIDYTEINPVLAAELRRIEFKNGYLGKDMTSQRLNGISKELQTHLEQKLILTTDFLAQSKDEKILSLRIIYELAPFVLDYQNDKENFRKLYDNSLLLVQYINNHFIKKSFAEYVINVFNRKAFLFAAPSQASIYYEQAVSYFKDNNIWDEFIIALASKAGNEVALHRYAKAIESCNNAISTIEKYELEIPQKEKIYNNLYIAEFLYFESQDITDLHEIQSKAVETAKKLEKILTPASSGMNHVILTNIASLYLYANLEKKYNQIKERLEISIGCKNVSDINDVRINDFYRYHFAWYEFYVNLKHNNWEKCIKILNSLDSFYPSIFHNIEKMNLRIEAAQYLIKQKIIPDIREYGINMLQYAPSDRSRYTSRGLLLSDLQFTSWE